MPWYTYCITTMPPNPRLCVGTTGNGAIPKRARRPKRRNPHPVPPLRRTRGKGDTSTERRTRRTTHGHGPESDHSHPHQHRMGRTQAPLWHEDDFVSGHVQTAIQHWKGTIPTAQPQRDEFLGYIGGVRLSEFIHPMPAGIFESSQFKGADVTSIKLPSDAPTLHDGWVNTEIESLVQKGSLVAWSTVADTETQPRQRIYLPLGVEPIKPPLIWDARYLNPMCKHFPFQMDGVGKIAQCSWKGAQQVTLDHKSGFHNVPLTPECWEYFGLCWRGVYYVWTVLCFGWCASRYIYHSLSDAVAQYLRSQDIPTSAWLADVWMSNPRATRDLSPTGQKRAAREAVALALTIVYRCGYFMAFPKCSLEPTTDRVFLGVGCHTVQSRFYVPEDKLRKLEVILRLRDAIDSRSVQPTRKTSREMYKYIRRSTTGQPVHTPHVPPDRCI